jgi:4-oxalmesaconate hydratase
MIIDCHGHYTTSPRQHEAWRSEQIAAYGEGRAAPPRPAISDDEIRASIVNGQLKLQQERGTDLTIFSPRAAGMGHHLGDAATSEAWAAACNELIHRVCTLFPRNFIGVCMLPQTAGVSPRNCVAELERCVQEYGFVGCNLNPDPSGGFWKDPPLGDRYWYPLYEKMVELDVPGMIHSSTCLSSRLNYTLHFINEESIALVSLVNSKVFEHFPKLKIVVAHGGGAIPYHMGRFMAGRYQSRRDMARKAVSPDQYFENVAKKLFYDTCVYSSEGLELLFKVIGPANCCFGTEAPGAGSSVNPHNGKAMDDLRPIIEGFNFLSDSDKKAVFEGNARKLYRI